MWTVPEKQHLKFASNLQTHEHTGTHTHALSDADHGWRQSDEGTLCIPEDHIRRKYEDLLSVGFGVPSLGFHCSGNVTTVNPPVLS